MFSKHVTSVHRAGAGSQLEALILQCEEPVDKISPTACHLCNEWEANLLDSNQDAKRAFLNEGKKAEPYGTLAQFRRHLGRHMEQLALFALPIDEVEEAEDQSDSQSDDNESARSEIEQIIDADSVLEEALKGQLHPGHPAFVNDPREDMVNAQQNTHAASVQQFANSLPYEGADRPDIGIFLVPGHEEFLDGKAALLCSYSDEDDQNYITETVARRLKVPEDPDGKVALTFARTSESQSEVRKFNIVPNHEIASDVKFGMKPLKET
jgi:hypothetical protein